MSSCTLPIYLGLVAAVVAVVLAFMFIEAGVSVKMEKLHTRQHPATTFFRTLLGILDMGEGSCCRVLEGAVSLSMFGC